MSKWNTTWRSEMNKGNKWINDMNWISEIRGANGPKACKTLRTGLLLRILLQLLLHVYLCGGGPPPDINPHLLALTRDPGFRCQIIPELVWPYSRTRLLKFRSRLAYSWIHLAFLIEKVANMVPTWLPKWSQDGQKIDPKIDHFLMLLKSIFGWIMLDYDPKLSHVGNKMVSKIDVNFERPFFKKTMFSLRKSKVFWKMTFRS